MTTRRHTGARVTLEFWRNEPLVAGQRVEAHYDFAGDGRMRTAVGIATPTRVGTHMGKAAFHYRLSHWIGPEAVMRYDSGNVRRRADERSETTHHAENRVRVTG